MLIDFSFSNFKSFRARQNFSTKRDDGWSSDAPYGTVAAVYGGNAAGKSNFVDALEYVNRFVRKSFVTAADEAGTGRSPYRLDLSGPSEKSVFVVRFDVESSGEYEYEFSVDDDVVWYERLQRWGSSRPSKVFERQTTETKNGYEIRATYGKAFRGPRAVYEKALRENALLLSVLASAGNESIADAFDFLARRIHVYRASAYGGEMDNVASYMQEDPKRAQALQTLVRGTGLGISGIELDSSMQEQLLGHLSTATDKERVRNFYSATVDLAAADIPASERSDMVDKLMRAEILEGTIPRQLVFGHEGEKGTVFFKKRDESEGTIAAISFLSVALRDLSSQSVTVVDEIDSSLHPSMVRALVNLYQDALTNPHDSQLIFTTHDVSLLMQSIDGGDTLMPDQVWLVEKRSGRSELYPVTEYGVTSDENMARNYLNGQYDGVPQPTLREAFALALEILGGTGGKGGDSGAEE